ncbi:cytochrome P450 [Amycolatopsis vastitatis]|uniref:cytochrome P450 n=1 Tax=Amycolatopsis vastitatis TaxID=1905142 RepID=UPI00130473F9|nr:cytochrome P450 [Amycolatopsis vastitatis]
MDIAYDPLLLADDPYPAYRRLRAEEPVYRGQTGEGISFWALSRFADVQAAAVDWESFSSAEGNDLDDTGLLFGPAPAMDCADPPQHTRMRNVLRKMFSASVINERFAPLVHRKVRSAVSELAGQEDVDFAEGLAYSLPAGLICELLGFPRSDHGQLRAWHSRLLAKIPGSMSLPPDAMSAHREMWQYLTEQLADRRKSPRDDLLSVLASAQLGGALSQDEVLANVMFLFDAGIVSTNSTIASALLHMHEFSDQWQLLRRSPAISASAVEEFLRFDAPFHWFKRVTTREVKFHDVSIPAGARVILIWASANRDERRWEDSEKLLLDRPVKSHLTFSTGIHHCVGSLFARLELKVLFEELAARMVDYEITGAVKRRVTPSERTIVSLPARVLWEK